MLDLTALPPDALAFYKSLSLGDQVALNHSNLPFYSLEDLTAYRQSMLAGNTNVLYQSTPEQAVPSNGELDPQDSV
ncbi:MAG: hypothetical protein H6Q60_1005 [Oscillospiraceae bacterium]|nr:hypothetical protein [Oscillospiraceae bacterium]